MIYRTTCPHCVSIFRLGPDQIEAAEGWVQCSVCGAAFDAYPSLLMEDGSPLPVVAPEPEFVGAPLAEPVVEAHAGDETLETLPSTEVEPDAFEPPAFEPAELEPTDLESAELEPTESGLAEDSGASTPQGIAQREAPFELPSIILIDPDADASDDPGPLPHISAPSYPARQDTPSYPPPPAFPPAAPAAHIEYAGTSFETAPVYTPPPRRTSTWIWVIASLLLTLGLAAQITYFMRDILVSRFPQSRPVLEQACEVLGCSFSLPQNLDLIRIVGSDLQTEASGRLKLTLTLGNRASSAQAWPVLVLTLMDQRNRPLARRSFAPSEYLGDDKRIAAGVPPRSEQVLNLPLNVKNLRPMGFDLRLTY